MRKKYDEKNGAPAFQRNSTQVYLGFITGQSLVIGFP
jgi:hypothetical protein